MQSEHYSFVDGAIFGPNLLLATEEEQHVLILDLAKIVYHLLYNLYLSEDKIIDLIMRAFGVTRDAATRIYHGCLVIMMESLKMRVVDIEDPFTSAKNDPDLEPSIE